MNTFNIVNEPLREPFIEKGLEHVLRSILESIPWLKGWDIKSEFIFMRYRFDFQVQIPLNNHMVRLLVVCKSELRPSRFSMLSYELQPVLEGDKADDRFIVPVLAARHVSPRLAQVCKEHGWSWLDLAGNCHVDVPGLLHIEHSGNKPIAPVKVSGANLSTLAAASVLRALMITDRDGGFWTQRQLQARCKPKVSIGLVNKIVRHLCNGQFIVKTEGEGYRLRDPVQLLYTWRDAYRFDQVKQVRCFSLLRGGEMEDKLVSLNKGRESKVAYAAFSAADIQAPAVRQPKKWLAVLKKDIEEVMHSLEAKAVDSGDNLVLLVPPDEGSMTGLEERAGGVPCTHPVHTCLDLWHLGGRGEEAAEAILEQCLKPAWREKGWLA